MADKTVIIRLDVQEAGASAQIQKLNTDLSKLTQGTNEYDLVLKKIALQEDRLIKIQAKRAVVQGDVLQSTEKVSKSLVKQKDTTGAATSATLEFGRVLSDMPYGIRGVANNLQQLAANLFFMSKKTSEATGKSIGFGGAITSLIKGLTGPAGALVAFQGLTALWDWYSNRTDKATDSTEEATKATKDLSSELKSLEATLADSGLSFDNYNAKILDYIKLKKEQEILDENILATKSKIEAQRKIDSDSLADDIVLAERLKKAKEESKNPALSKRQELFYSKDIENIQSRINNNVIVRADAEKEIVRLTKEGLDEIAKVENAKKELSKAEQGTLKFMKEELSELKQKRQITQTDSEEFKKQTIEIENRQKIIDEIEGKKRGKGKGDKIKLIEFEDFNETAENYRSELSKLTEQFELIDAKSEVEKLEIKKKYHLARLDAQHVESTQKYEQTAIEYKAELKLYLDQQVLLGLMSKEASARKLQEFDENTNVQVSQSQKSFDTLRGIQKAFYDNQILEASTAGLKLAGNGNTIATQENIDLLAHLKRKSDAYASYAETVKEVLSSVSDFIDSEFQRELIIEQNKTNSANQALNDRLLNENLSKDQRASIQNQIAQNDEKLRVKQEKIARKQFAVEKAFKIGMAIADTASSALRAFSSQINPLDPTSLARAVVAASAATAFGLAQVAMIARTKFQSSAPASPANASLGGGSGGGSGRAEPSFNIVGRSNENILLNAIQAQFDKPLKAYVVARDVTNQQQLDGIISNTSSI